jgi:hypothetical protein
MQSQSMLIQNTYNIFLFPCQSKFYKFYLYVINIEEDQGYWKNRLSQQLFKVFIYTYILPLHVSAFTGHLQAEYAIFWEVTSLIADPLCFCYKSYLHMLMANTAIVYLNVTVKHPNMGSITSLLS